MTNQEVYESALLAREWSRQEVYAYVNALNWLYQAANGVTPHGDASCTPPTKPTENNHGS